MNKEILIVGQGLAGTLLSYQLQKRGINHKVLCNNKTNTSSKIAAGIYNPIVFKRITKSWMIDDLYPEMINAFSDLEKILNIEIINPIPIAKLIKPDEYDWWNKRINSQNLQSYFNGFKPNNSIKNINIPYDFASINKTGFISINALLTKYNEYLHDNKLLIKDTMQYDEISFVENEVNYYGTSYSKIIFCEGADAVNNPYFPQQSFYLSRGDIIEVTIPDLPREQIINKDVFILPKGKDAFLIGSTYGHEKLENPPNKKDLDYLLDKVAQITTLPVSVKHHKVGIRPTVKDRRPILGFHPDKESIGFLNGMGTKGVLLAPYFAKQLAKSLFNNENKINPEVDIKRFF